MLPVWASATHQRQLAIIVQVHSVMRYRRLSKLLFVSLLYMCTSAHCGVGSDWFCLWDMFIAPNRAHRTFSKVAGGLIVLALVGLRISSETVNFED